MNAAISWRSQECNTPWIFISSSRHLIFLVHRVANTVVQSIIPQPHGQWGDPLSTLQLNTRWNTGLFWMTEHMNIHIWTGHNNSSREDELPLFAELGSSACQRGQKGLPEPGATSHVPWDAEGHTGTCRFLMRVAFKYPLCHSQQPKGTLSDSPPALIFSLLLKNLKISGQ